jgi:hypothetical protein
MKLGLAGLVIATGVLMAVGVGGEAGSATIGLGCLSSEAEGGTKICEREEVASKYSSSLSSPSFSSSELRPPSSSNAGPPWFERMVPMPSVCVLLED